MKRRNTSSKQTSAVPDFFSADVAEARRFYLNLNPARSRRVVVVCGGLEHCTPDYSIERDSFPFYSIEYVVRGRGEVKLKGRSYPLRPGSVFSYGLGVPHRITGDPGNPLVKYFVDFAGARATELLCSCGLPPGRVSEVYPAGTLQPLFNELIQAGLQLRRESVALCAKLLECLALRIIGTQAPLKGAETLAFTTYQRCRDHMEQHSLRLRTLEQIADECHVNSAYLCRLFRRYDDQSPYQYLLRLKMNIAAERLRQPGVLVKQVAGEAGFSDPFHFCRVFRSVLGLSPTAFRGLARVWGAGERHP
jgi:AraC-like DNA-binding protein/quercetin dioxygenase-like cupin family protein